MAYLNAVTTFRLCYRESVKKVCKVESSFQLTRQLFTSSGYFLLHFASNSSRAARAISSVGAL